MIAYCTVKKGYGLKIIAKIYKRSQYLISDWFDKSHYLTEIWGKQEATVRVTAEQYGNNEGSHLNAGPNL